MSTKEEILSRYRSNVKVKFDMPTLDDINAIRYEDPLKQFISMSESVGGKAIEVEEGADLKFLFVAKGGGSALILCKASRPAIIGEFCPVCRLCCFRL